LLTLKKGMSYALLAELHPVYGLYTDFLFPVIYMLFGGQPQIVVGTSAIEAMMTGEAITKLTG
jgi:MFS superfamily sulfate permease-like transporter